MVNLLAVLGAGIASMVIGYLWYGPLFGKIWMELSGFKKSEMGKMKTTAQVGYAGQFVASLVMAYVLGMFIEVTKTLWASSRFSDYYISAFGTAIFLWLGFIATTTLGSVLWEGKPVKLYLLNNAYHLLTAFVMAAILVSLP